MANELIQNIHLLENITINSYFAIALSKINTLMLR